MGKPNLTLNSCVSYQPSPKRLVSPRRDVKLLRSSYMRVKSMLNTRSPPSRDSSPIHEETVAENEHEEDEATPHELTDLGQIQSEVDVLQTTLRHMKEELKAFRDVSIPSRARRKSSRLSSRSSSRWDGRLPRPMRRATHSGPSLTPSSSSRLTAVVLRPTSLWSGQRRKSRRSYPGCEASNRKH